MLLAGPFYAAALLLVLAGAQKAADPRPLVRAARSTGLAVPAPVVRAVAAGELLLGLAALAGAPGAAVGVALSYAAFTGFVLLALARGGVLASCGCFGKADVPPTRTHAAVTGALSLAALAAGGAGAVPLQLPLLVATAAVAVCAYLVLAVLPLVAVR